MTGPPEGFTSEVIEVRGFGMHVVRGGSGPPLMIVHGGWDSWYAWRDIAPALADRHTVILPALRGLAGSDKPADGYDADNLGTDLRELLRALGHEHAAVVAHDFGAVAAYTLAAQYPDAVSRLAIFEMVLPGCGLLEQAMVPQPGGAYLWHMGFHSVPDIPEMLIEGHLPEYMRWFFTAGAASPTAVGQDVIDVYVDLYRRPGAIPAFMQYYRNLWTHAEQVQKHMEQPLTMPVMAWGGDASVGQGAQMCMSQLAADVRGGVIPDCGHWVAEEQPGFVLERLTEFLAEELSPEVVA